MATVAREAKKTAAFILGAAAVVGSAIGWYLGGLLERHNTRRKSR